MKDLIKKASEILKDSFHLKPEKSKFYLHENIQEFLKQTRNPNAQSMFLPKDLSAHIPNNRLDLAIHEYFGHGTYCEHAPYGKKMVENEQKLESMSEEEIKEALTIHEYFLLQFEGHAIWTEDFLLKSLKQEEILEKRINEYKQSKINWQFYPQIRSQMNIYNLMKNFENDFGIHELWYSFGFPIFFDEKTIIEITKEKLRDRFENLKLLILFGSKNPKSDIDLCAILDDNTEITEHPYSDKIDLTEYNYTQFITKIKLFAIPVTQPLITGEPVYGDKNLFHKIKSDLLQQSPNSDAINYLRSRYKWCLETAREIYKSHPKILDAQKITLNKLAYSISCLEFAKAYEHGSRVITFKEINNPLINNIRAYMKSNEITCEGVDRFIQEVERL